MCGLIPELAVCVPGAARHAMTRCRPGTPVGLTLETGVPDQRCTAVALHRVRDTLGQAMPSFMDIALDEARAARDAGEVPVGCAIVRDGVVITRGGNRT